MRDPREGVGSDGCIVTGVDRRAVPALFEPLLSQLLERLAVWPDVAVYLYGSVATGQARVGRSDVDVLTVGLPAERAAEVGADLGERFAELCRGVELAPAGPEDLTGTDDAAYGLRVFLRHYCLHLEGPDPSADLPPFPADARAARGFNGDIERHLAGWRGVLAIHDPEALGRRVARKTLLATAGLVSVLDATWTTDRERAVRSFARHRPDLADDLETLLAWATDETVADAVAVAAVLRPDGVVGHVVEQFREVVGLWPSEID